jgi:hypothetical protein
MHKAISPGSEFSGIGIDLPIDPQCGSADAKPKPTYPDPAELPTQQGAQGLKFDFKDGTRVFCPEGEKVF